MNPGSARRRRLVGLAVFVVVGCLVVGVLRFQWLRDEPGRQAGRPAVVTAPQKLLWGLAPDPELPVNGAMANAAGLLHRDVDIVHRFISMAWREDGQRAVLRELAAESTADRFIMISWEPGLEGSSGGVSLDAIAAGTYDSQIRRFAGDLSRFEGPVALRFAHEMNGSWYPWAGQPDAYRRAWQRMASLMRAEAPAVRLVWAVNNVDVPAGNSLESYWPGSDLVDIIGIDGYNCLRGWETPEQVFRRALQRVSAVGPGIPIWLTETSSCEATNTVAGTSGHSKAEWIAQLFELADRSHLQAVVWFDRNKEYDWRITSSPEATASLVAALAPS